MHKPTCICVWSLQNIKSRGNFLLTSVVTVIHFGMLFTGIIREFAVSSIVVVFVLSIIINPLYTGYRPFDHLTFAWVVSQQEKWRFGGKENRSIFFPVTFAAKLDSRVLVVRTIRKRSIMFIFILFTVVIIPVDKAFSKVCRAGSPFVDTILSCRDWSAWMTTEYWFHVCRPRSCHRLRTLTVMYKFPFFDSFLIQCWPSRARLIEFQVFNF